MSHAQPMQTQSGDYDSILDAVMETARGRWFIAEFGRRNRQAETERILDALRGIERRMTQGAPRSGHPDLSDLAAIFALRNGGDAATGLTANVVADIARESGAGAEAVREHLLTARGAVKALAESGAEARYCAAIDKAMRGIDLHAGAQIETGRKIEALAQIVGTIRERVRHLVDAASEPQVANSFTPLEPDGPPPANDPSPIEAAAPSNPPAAGREEPPILFEDDPPPPPASVFEGGIPMAAVGPGARLRLAIADEEQALREAEADIVGRPVVEPPARRPAPATPRVAEYDRMNYRERHALFAS